MPGSIPINYWIFFFGLLLVVIGLIGGGVEIKEIRIPTLPLIPRALIFILGAALALVSLLEPQWFNLSGPTAHDSSIAILYNPDKKDLASQMKQYLAGKGYESVAVCDNFSEIEESDHQRAGTVRIVYNSNKPAADRIAGVLHDRFSSDIARLIETPNDKATAANVQIQLWGVPSDCT